MGRGGWVLSESVNKMKIQWSSKKLWNMTSADVKTDVKQK